MTVAGRENCFNAADNVSSHTETYKRAYFILILVQTGTKQIRSKNEKIKEIQGRELLIFFSNCQSLFSPQRNRIGVTLNEYIDELYEGKFHIS